MRASSEVGCCRRSGVQAGCLDQDLMSSPTAHVGVVWTGSSLNEVGVTGESWQVAGRVLPDSMVLQPRALRWIRRERQT